MDLKELLSENPRFHHASHGLVSFRLEDDALQYIAAHANDQTRTLETGAGVSTVAFIQLGTYHTCVNPRQDEIERIKAYCKTRSIPLEKAKFIVEKSEYVLPAIKEEPLDFVLIDGDHKFPIPFLDWYYTAPLVRIGGRVIIDDLQLWTGDVLRRFLLMEDEWMLDRQFERSAAFIKVREGSQAKWWGQQPFVVSMGRPIARQFHFQLALRHLARGELYKSAVSLKKVILQNPF